LKHTLYFTGREVQGQKVTTPTENLLYRRQYIEIGATPQTNYLKKCWQNANASQQLTLDKTELRTDQHWMAKQHTL